MKFGYFCNISNWTKKPHTEILNEAREIAKYCDLNNWNSIIDASFLLCIQRL